MNKFLFGFAIGVILTGATGAILHIRSQPVRYSAYEINECRRLLHERLTAPQSVRAQLDEMEKSSPEERTKWEVIKAIACSRVYM